MPICTRWFLALFTASLCFTSSHAFATDYYVSAERGKGKAATKEEPARDLGNIASKLAPGDTVHIATGEYLGKGKNGADEILVPVSIIGGYSDDFSKRDPWGECKTILTGVNDSKNYTPAPRLFINLNKYQYHESGGTEMPKIVIDGLIIDQGPQNRYGDEAKSLLVRKANPTTGENPTPDSGALKISASKTKNLEGRWEIEVRNCVIMNSAPTQGALNVNGYANSIVTIDNNLVINNTGTGLYAGSLWQGSEEASAPKFTITNNTVLFTEKYDAFAQSFSGNSFKCDGSVVATVSNNVFAFADRNGIQKEGKWPLTLTNNIIMGNVQADYWETAGDAKIELDSLEDEAEYLGDESCDNVAPEIKVPVSPEWATLYAGRVIIDRNAAAADVQAQKTKLNGLRGILGLPLQADDLNVDSPVWLPLMQVDDALKAGMEKYDGRYGCAKPQV
ncbi:right-handed parallel beta-helix repeat-containing protein [Candidatus Sumerlaeota bacterium]|nr:right-handed parallel beta-helix repeat-containing protein [Candidatus Sumerlaeota bacterium]